MYYFTVLDVCMHATVLMLMYVLKLLLIQSMVMCL